MIQDAVSVEVRPRNVRAHTSELSKKVNLEAAYFEGHAERMRHAECRRQDLLVSSGVIEAGCRSVIGVD